MYSNVPAKGQGEWGVALLVRSPLAAALTSAVASVFFLVITLAVALFTCKRIRVKNMYRYMYST